MSLMMVPGDAVEKFAKLTSGVEDTKLERPWVWGSYEEGVRFSFFRVYEELRQLAALLADMRSGASPLTLGQRILAQYHAAYRDLEAVLLDVTDKNGERSPGGEEWSTRQALIHIIEADRGFYFVIKYALERARGSDSEPSELTDEGWDAFWAGDPFTEMKDGVPLSEIIAYYRQHHQRILEDFAAVSEAELALPSVYWEDEPMPLLFRMHRFDAHLRQHTIQIEKTLAALNLAPKEAKRLLRLVYSALAELEGSLIGAWDLGMDARQVLSSKISTWREEVIEAFG